MQSPPPTKQQRRAVASIIAGVRALGRYHEKDNDEDCDRAATYPCNRTFADIKGGRVVIYSGPYGPKEGSFTPDTGERIPLDDATMTAILRLLDDNNFPCYDGNELS